MSALKTILGMGAIGSQLVLGTELSSKYQYIPTRMKWSEAEAYCKSTYGTHLASIHSYEEHEAVMDACLSPPGSNDDQHCWIGLTDQTIEGEFEWSG